MPLLLIEKLVGSHQDGENSHIHNLDYSVVRETEMRIITRKKNNIFTDSWGQLVSQGEVLVAKGFTQGGLCHFMDAHLSTVSMFQRDSGHNVFLCTFPITVAQISLTNHPSSYLPSLVTYNERGCSGDSAAAKSKEEGRVAWGEGLEGGAAQRIRLASLWKHFCPGRSFFVYTVVP